MYLKSIEVQGFKSFAHKTKFEFHNGITAIVGPNGSGKSNVADAVRWVFGEQSAKQLRGSNMQDIIFAGTQERRPQSFAYVSLTLDNEDHALDLDYQEVTVTRKVYRSGESEYLINNNTCRLKDILELFYDTGIGKEGYSIIGQGQVDKIISGKMDDRRELFDEACGIVKLKKRRTAAQRKLEHEALDMLRISDKVADLERQAGPLKRQSETAREYLRLRDELKIYDINAFLIDHSQYQNQLKDIDQNLKITVDELASKQEDEAKLKESYASLEEQIGTLEHELEDMRVRVNEGTEQKSRIEGEIKVAGEKQHTAEADLARHKERIETADQKISEKETAVQTAEDERLALAEEETLLVKEQEEAQLKETEAETKIRLYRKNAEENQQGLIGILNERNETGSRLSALTALISEHQERLKEIEEEAENLEKERTVAEKTQADLTEERTASEALLKEKNQELTDTGNALEEAETAFEDARRRSYELKQQFQINRSRYETLRGIMDQYEGISNAIRRIMEVRSRFPGICGVISDLIETDKKYQTAIEAALGGNYQNIVTEKEQDAKALISFLKENRAGRATFLPLDAVRSSGRLADERILKEEGVLGTADQLVRHDPKYQACVRYLLERIVVVDHLDRALALARKYRYQMRLVTLEGDILSAGGAVTGGSFRNANHYLNRSNELKELEQKNASLSKEITEAERQQNRENQLKESLSLEYSDIQEEIQDITVELTKNRSMADHLRGRLILIRQEEKELSLRKDELTAALKKDESEKRSIEEAIEALEKMNASSDSSRNEIDAMLQEAEASYEEARKHTAEITLKLSETRQKLKFLAQEKERLKQEIEELRAEKTSAEEDISGLEELLSVIGEEEDSLKEKLQKAADELALLEQKYDGLLKDKEALNQDQKQYLEMRESLTASLSELSKEEIRLESQKDKTEERLDNLVSYLWSEYELTPSEAEKSRDTELDNPGRIRRHAQELKSAIKKLGNVNVNAIEQYAEVSELYEFYSAQYEDLKKAEEDLKTVIQELDEGMRKRFREQFAAINDEYDRVFKELFGGGQGTLELNDGDILNCDIHIISQPPGKKLQNMMQLSGGEKALSAIALIFAMQNLKPSPFCLLDEIEAALDESNVGRFTGYLRKLTHSTQFIVITHRRGTMVAADRLYGITMQEKGVSTLISVNLVEKELSN